MAWNGTPAQKRAWKQKKERERQAAGGDDKQPKPGYRVAPAKHRCDVAELEFGVKVPGSHLPGVSCSVCGRTWGHQKVSAGYARIVSPVTEKAPAPTVRFIPSPAQPRNPTGARNEFPPDDLTGSARGNWWREHAEVVTVHRLVSR